MRAGSRPASATKRKRSATATQENSGHQVSGSARREVRQASFYTATNFATQFGSFLIVPLFWQKLTLVDYGVIGLTEMIATFLQLFLGLSIDSSITRFYYEWPASERRRRVGTLWMLSWAACIASGAVSIGVFAMASGWLFPDVAFYPYIFFGLIVAILRSMLAAPDSTIRIVNSPRLYAWYTLGAFSQQMSLSILFVLVLDRGLYGYFVSSIIGGAVSVALSGVIMLRFATPALERAGLDEALRFSLPSIPTSIISAVTQVTDRFLLQRYASIEALGIYSISLKFTSLVLHLNNSLKLSFLPYMTKGIAADVGAGVRAVVYARRYYMVPLVVGSICIAVFIDDFVRMAGQPEYVAVAEWIPWFMGPVLISTLTLYYAPGLFLGKRTDLTWIPQMVQLAMVAAAGVLLIPRLGLGGVVVSRYASTVVLFACTLVLSQRVWPIAVEWGYLACIFGIAALSAVIGAGINTGSPWLDLAIRAVIVSAAVGALSLTAAGGFAALRLEFGSFFLAGREWGVTGGRRRPDPGRDHAR